METKNELPPRIYQKEPLPTFRQMQAFIENPHAQRTFIRLTNYIAEHYDMPPEIIFGGKNFGVMLRYRKSEKTLVCIFPEKNAIYVVVVLGGKLCEEFNTQQNLFSPSIVDIFDTTKQYHDGKWLGIRMEDASCIKDITRLLTIKKKPKKQRPSIQT